jgi:hypothetical protein
VRLTAGGQSVTQPLEVRLDPTIGAADPDLRRQFDTNLKLRDMQSSVNDALKSIDTFKAELEQAEKNVKTLDPQAPKVLTGLITERKQQLSSMELKLARPDNIPGYSMGPRLVDRLGQLLGAIDRVLAAPTPYQGALQRIEVRVFERYGRRERLHRSSNSGNQRHVEEEQCWGDDVR